MSDVSAEHLIREHGMAPEVVKAHSDKTSSPANRVRGAARHASLWLEMKHSADHAVRRVGHEHTGETT